MIALLARTFIKNMKKEVEAKQYMTIGSNLLEETSDGKVLGTMMDHILMHVEMGMDKEISTGSFVYMEENISATHVMFPSASKSLLDKLKQKLQDEVITKVQVIITTLMANV